MSAKTDRPSIHAPLHTALFTVVVVPFMLLLGGVNLATMAGVAVLSGILGALNWADKRVGAIWVALPVAVSLLYIAGFVINLVA
jgi:hypothetical protein